MGAANTLWFEGDRLVADNTDGVGFMSHLRRHRCRVSTPREAP